MMKMKIKLNEAKAKENGKYTLDEMYKKIDNLANEVNITKKEGKNIYIGNNDKYDLACFGRIAMALGECHWFLNCVDEWIWHLDDGTQDMIEFYEALRRDAV